MLLGSPVGPSPYCEAIVTKWVSKIREILSRLSDLEDLQIETTLLRLVWLYPMLPTFFAQISKALSLLTA